MNRSNITWLVNADGTPGYTWSPTSGCGPGLPCYERCWARLYHVHYRKGDFSVKLHPDQLDAPLRLRKPSVIGVSLMGDVAHENVPIGFFAQIWATMALSPQHTYLLLTKRPENLRSMLTADGLYDLVLTAADYARGRHPRKHLSDVGVSNPVIRPLPNVWIGPSVWDQPSADAMIPVVLDTPAAHRFVSLEPQIGAVDFGCWTYNCIVERCDKKTDERTEWCGGGIFGLPSYCVHGCPHAKTTGGIELVIQGCESGPRRRPFDVPWARDVRDQCKAAGTGYYLKQAPWESTEKNDRGDTWTRVEVGRSRVYELPTLDGHRCTSACLPWSHQAEGAR